MSLPIVIAKSGAQPRTPSDLRTDLVDRAVALDPGLTTNLPGSLIEDVASTDVGGLLVCDSAFVDLINSLTPYGANDQLMTQLGNVYGVPQGVGANGSVLVVFVSTNGASSVGFSIPVGFTVTDGAVQYVIQDGGIVGVDGTAPLFALASTPGVFAIPVNTVTTLVTGLPPDIALSVTNPEAGTQASGPQTYPAYRAQVLQAGLAASLGMTRYLKTLLGNVVGVQQRLISVRMVTGGWEVIVGGGDSYQIADAIFDSVFDIPSLRQSTIAVTGITNAVLGVVTTDLNHGLVTGQANARIAGVNGMSGVNGGPYTVTVISEKTFTFGVNTTLSGAYVDGGVVTPNARNVVVSINDYPDTYNVPFVVPPLQTVGITLTWNTTAVNFVSDAAVAQLGAQAISDYVNSIPVRVDMNLFVLESTFQDAVADLIPKALLSRMVFAVAINGISVPPDMGTGLIEGDPESYFQMMPSQVIVTRG